MSLIHEALEKARKSTSNVEAKKVKEKKTQRVRPILFLMVFIILTWAVTMAVLLKTGSDIEKGRFVGKRMTLSTSDASEDSTYNALIVDSLRSNREDVRDTSTWFDSARFFESFNGALSSGNTELLRDLTLNNLNLLSSADFQKVLKIFMTLDDYKVVKEISAKADKSGKLNANLLLELAKYFEMKDQIASAYYYRRSYFAGNADPILLAKAGSLYDKEGLRDSAVKYYRIYLNLADTGELFFNIKRRLDYLANRER
ncbi:MAG: hypothetical protein QMD82_07460 [bacterium]|nr:hypothetical protein [bacterium]